MNKDKIFAATFVVLVSTAIIGFSAGNTGANFTGASTNPNQAMGTSNVIAPASVTPTSAIAGAVNLAWPATTTPPNGHTVTYLVLRNGVQIGTTAALTYSDTPGSDGTYSYTVQTKIAQGAGFFTSASSSAGSGRSDRTAPTMAATCNGGSCAGWFKGNVTFVVSSNDGTGVGMGTATYKVDAGATNTVAAPASFSVNGDSAGHTVVYSGADAVGNASGNSSQTVRIDGTPPPAAALSGTRAGPTQGSVTLNWTQAADATSGVASFDVYKINIAGSGTPCPAAGYTLVVSGLGAGTTSYVTNVGNNAWACLYVVTSDNATNTTNSNIVKVQGK